MVRPPETERVWPVVYSASSGAKKTTARAMSSGQVSLALAPGHFRSDFARLCEFVR